MIIILSGAIISMVWGVWRVMRGKKSTEMQQNLGLAGILVGAVVAIAANFTRSNAGVMTLIALLAAAAMLVLAILCVSAIRRPEGGATTVDLAAIMIGVFAFLVGSVFH
ncbi:hypothetical protein [Dehalogenimonas etheniformans]|uniref:Uncharacterized protein n=1 Tax=Dehalogenimonas etheniformans TaxID=1536648 RepID=A0A2P5P5C3_9CHLR|nr:hypothetical protein [Dehalogenimonas etheniformans]PPD57498.1 hypothetical protein JP09_009225 [Dehalogenimonas etheniformans]QNT76860.1 hypothetical protein HX448_09320 [Dehalogenimonas etheniformans]